MIKVQPTATGFHVVVGCQSGDLSRNEAITLSKELGLALDAPAPKVLEEGFMLFHNNIPYEYGVYYGLELVPAGTLSPKMLRLKLSRPAYTDLKGLYKDWACTHGRIGPDIWEWRWVKLADVVSKYNMRPDPTRFIPNSL